LFSDTRLDGVRLSHTHGVTNLEVNHLDSGWRVTNLKPTQTYVDWLSLDENARVISGADWTFSSRISAKSAHLNFSRKEIK